MKTNCPICKSEHIEILVKVEEPTLQNRVYATPAEAQQAVKGPIYLTHCHTCNFTFNSAFDESIIVYDEHYDNAVPSKLFIDYYHSICHYLYQTYQLEEGIVYDIGCGKGTFLSILCTLYPNIKAVGIDPSYEGDLNPMSNLMFIRDFFKTEHVTEKPSLILSRHVFEHIEYPKEFLSILREPIQQFPDVPFFIEVPDFEWIVANQTFWDICYEHCNYFSKHALTVLCTQQGSHVTKITPAFGNQYLWIEGRFNGSTNTVPSFPNIDFKHIQAFIQSIKSSQTRISSLIRTNKQQDRTIIVWGMATKGVIFSNQIDMQATLIDHCIDINKEKQGKYSPLSAHLIEAPTSLSILKGKNCFVIMMNSNYIQEIKQEVTSLGIQAQFVDAHGNEL